MAREPERWTMLKKLAAGTDYFADLGATARLVAALALAPFALFFTVAAVLTPVAAICIVLIERDWQLAGMVFAGGLLYLLLAIPLCWLTLRLLRGRKASNAVTVLPSWLVRAFLLAFLLPLSVGVAGGMAVWAFREVAAGNWRGGGLLAAMACGFLVSMVRAIPVAWRLGRRGGGGLPRQEQAGQAGDLS
jgi:hypothetical protein